MISGICGRCKGPSLAGPICTECRRKGKERFAEWAKAVEAERVQGEASMVRDIIAQLVLLLENHPDVKTVEVNYDRPEVGYRLRDLDDFAEHVAEDEIAGIVTFVHTQYAFGRGAVAVRRLR